MTPASEQTPEEIAKEIVDNWEVDEDSSDYYITKIADAIRTEREKARVVWPSGADVAQAINDIYPYGDKESDTDVLALRKGFRRSIRWVQKFVEGRAK